MTVEREEIIITVMELLHAIDVLRSAEKRLLKMLTTQPLPIYHHQQESKS